MCDVGVKKFTIFFKIKIYKKTCKKFCRLQKDLYLCSVNKKTINDMKIGYQTKKGGEYFEPKNSDKVENFLYYCKIKYHYDEEQDIYFVSRETYRIILMLVINEIDF